jgi:hypothetical protein
VIPAAEFDAFRAALIADLRTLRAPDGTLVFEAVLDRHDAAVAGPDVANEPDAPDVLLRPAGMDWKVSDVVRERVFGHTDEYSHTWTGVVIAAGPGVGVPPEHGTLAPATDASGHPARGLGSSTDSPSASVIDVTPTVLELLGVPQPATVQGRPLVPAVTTADADPVTDRWRPEPEPEPEPDPDRAPVASSATVRPAAGTDRGGESDSNRDRAPVPDRETDPSWTPRSRSGSVASTTASASGSRPDRGDGDDNDSGHIEQGDGGDPDAESGSVAAPGRFHRRFLQAEESPDGTDADVGSGSGGRSTASRSGTSGGDGGDSDREVDDVVTDRLREMGYL